MSETRYREVYTYSNDLPPEQRVPENAEITKVPYEVPDGQVHQEELDDEFNAAHTRVLRAVSNWEEVKPEQKDELLRFLARFYLYVMKKSYGVETDL